MSKFKFVWTDGLEEIEEGETLKEAFCSLVSAGFQNANPPSNIMLMLSMLGLDYWVEMTELKEGIVVWVGSQIMRKDIRGKKGVIKRILPNDTLHLSLMGGGIVKLRISEVDREPLPRTIRERIGLTFSCSK
tara:strand:- start:1291 stop:1686 length:396 start_codon:yes stop_codon:yes gene_type:complete